VTDDPADPLPPEAALALAWSVLQSTLFAPALSVAGVVPGDELLPVEQKPRSWPRKEMFPYLLARCSGSKLTIQS
jgi:hypothetical protein